MIATYLAPPFGSTVWYSQQQELGKRRRTYLTPNGRRIKLLGNTRKTVFNTCKTCFDYISYAQVLNQNEIKVIAEVVYTQVFL